MKLTKKQYDFVKSNETCRGIECQNCPFYQNLKDERFVCQIIQDIHSNSRSDGEFQNGLNDMRDTFFTDTRKKIKLLDRLSK